LFKYKNDNSISNNIGEPINYNSYYFPVKVFLDTINPNSWETELNTSKVIWFSQALHEMDEPILTNYYLNKEIYRLTLLRSFVPDIVVRIEKSNDSIELFEKTHFQYKSSVNDSVYYKDGIQIYCEHTVIDSIKVTKSSKKLSLEYWDKFEDVVRKNKYYSMRPTVPMDFGVDGDEWILEKHTQSGYYVVKRASAGRGMGLDSLRNICNSLISISGLKYQE
jgi:hypothetical protein